MTATTAPATPPSPPPLEPRPATGAVAYYRLPHPLREGDLLFYDFDAVRRALEQGARGAPLSRLALGPDAAPDEAQVRALESRLRRGFLGRARANAGRALWWLLLGPALSLLWINFAPVIAILFAWIPPVAVLVASLGAVTGGWVLATVVALAPLVWAWRRAAQHAAAARRWGRVARFAGSRRFRASPLERAADPAAAAFAEASRPLVAQLRAQLPKLAERGGDAAAEAAQLARSAYRLAVRHGLAGVAGAYHALYSRFAAAEQQLGLLERAGGGVFAERKAATEAQRARRETNASLAAYAPSGRVRSNALAPLGGLLAGLAALAFTLLLTGVYWVEPGQAVIVQPPQARLARLGSALGLAEPLAGAGASDAVDVVRSEGFHWTWPRPFASKHAVVLGEQRLRLRAPFRRTSETTYDVLLVELRFRISDVERWAQQDRDGQGVERLAAALASTLRDGIQQQRYDARQAVAQQNPSLPEEQVAAVADQLVEGRLQDTVRAFVGALSRSAATQEYGVQIAPEFQAGLVQGVPAQLVSEE